MTEFPAGTYVILTPFEGQLAAGTSYGVQVRGGRWQDWPWSQQLKRHVCGGRVYNLALEKDREAFNQACEEVYDIPRTAGFVRPMAIQIGNPQPKVGFTQEAEKLVRQHRLWPHFSEATGTGADGLITKHDVQAVLDALINPPKPPPPPKLTEIERPPEQREPERRPSMSGPPPLKVAQPGASQATQPLSMADLLATT